MATNTQLTVDPTVDFLIKFLKPPYEKTSAGFRMSKFDTLDPEMRSVINEYGPEIVVEIIEYFQKSIPPVILKEICEEARKEAQDRMLRQ